MPRLPHAAQVLIDQAAEKHKTSRYTVEGKPDGLDVNRTIKFNKVSGDYLAPLLEVIEDPRIVSWKEEKDGLVITFSDRPLADQADPFPLDEVDAVLND